MLYQTRIKIKSAVLGDRQGPDKVLRFQRGDNDTLVIPIDHWRWAVSEAVDGLRLGQVEKECMHSLVSFRAPTLMLYNRPYNLNGKRLTASHEAIRKGAELGFEVIVTSTPPIRGEAHAKGKFSPAKEEVEQILKFIGLFLGISPFGSHMGYGRYDLMSLEEGVPQL